jgi:hypothetical protein
MVCEVSVFRINLLLLLLIVSRFFFTFMAIIGGKAKDFSTQKQKAFFGITNTRVPLRNCKTEITILAQRLLWEK